MTGPTELTMEVALAPMRCMPALRRKAGITVENMAISAVIP